MASKYAKFMPMVAERFRRAVNVKVHIQPDGSISTHIPGFKYDDFNRAGMLCITSVNRLAEMSRVNGNHFTAESPGVFFLMFGRHWTFSRTLFDRAAVELPMIIRSSISGVGRSSVDVSQTIEDEKDGTMFASLAFRLVNIDPITRGSAVPIPESALKYAENIVIAGGARFPKITTPSSLPTETFSCPIAVRYDDMDFLFHTNQSSYLGFALECAAQAAEARFYSAIKNDIAFYRASRATGIYLDESHAGNELMVTTWEDSDNKMLLNFTVNKAEQMIYYAQIEFYPN